MYVYCICIAEMYQRRGVIDLNIFNMLHSDLQGNPQKHHTWRKSIKVLHRSSIFIQKHLIKFISAFRCI